MSPYKRLIHLEIIQKNPTTSLSLPRLPQTMPKSISKENAKKMVENPIQEGDYFIRNRAILECLYGGGLRVSELCQLNRENLEMKNGEAKLSVIGKGNKPRRVFYLVWPMMHCKNSSKQQNTNPNLLFQKLLWK